MFRLRLFRGGACFGCDLWMTHAGRRCLLGVNGIGSGQHPSPNVKTLCNFETQTWLEIITSRDAKSTCFKGSRTSCREIIFGIFGAEFRQKRSDGCFLLMGDRFLFSAGTATSWALSMRVPHPIPILDQHQAPMGLLSTAGAGICRKAPK